MALREIPGGQPDAYRPLDIVPFTLGPVETNTYLIADPETRSAVVIDPAWNGEAIVAEAGRRNYRIEAVWLTHAHFDHIGGAAGVMRSLSSQPELALHPDDRPLWEAQGGAPLFGLRIEQAPPPTLELSDGQTLKLGGLQFGVRHAPGHTPGHVVYYCPEAGVAFVGDVIFSGSIGRTDLPGGSYARLLDSIRRQILSLPDDTRLLSGHGPETTVGIERRENPFLT